MAPAPVPGPSTRSDTPKVERIGHRGAPREFPENSVPAFERAIELGADAVELDVHVTSDGVPVVHHDSDVSLSPTLGRSRGAISSMTWRDVSRVELAPGVFVPSLEQVLDAVGNRATVYVELKGAGSEESAIAVIRASRTRCAVHSFDHVAIARASRIEPEGRRGILFDEYPHDVVRAMHDASARDVWPQWELIDEALVSRVHAAGGRVVAWTVNTTAAADHLVRLEVDGLCGDDVRLLPK
jgi:glycerophosphoryl diester phosphodiesterase